MSPEDAELRNLYGQVILGYSPLRLKGNKTAYIRHFSPLDQSELDGEYFTFYNRAKEEGLATEEERLTSLKEEGLWTDADEKELENLEVYLEGRKTSKKNLPIPSQIEEANKDIEATSKQINDKKRARAELVGLVAEAYSRKKLNDLYIFKSLYSDRELRSKFFSQDDYDYLDFIDLDNIAREFNLTMEKLKEGTVKKIALSGFFQYAFDLCNDDIYAFYGKPIIQLTYYQTDLARFGRLFKNIFSGEHKPPAEVAQDPDKLIDWYNMANNADSMMKKQTGNNVAIMDGTAQDVEAISAISKEPTVTLNELTKGKTKMRGAELMKLLG